MSRAILQPRASLRLKETSGTPAAILEQTDYSKYAKIKPARSRGSRTERGQGRNARSQCGPIR